MATTLKLPFTRFVAQVNTAPAEPKANYQALAARNALALQACEWREASKSVKASLVTHNFTIAHSGDQYDAYLMTGDYSAANSTEIAYAGMAAYRFTLPAAYMSGAQTLVSMSLPITRDRFLLPGARVVAVLSDSTLPSAAWATVRGDASPAASETEYLKNSATRITAALDDSGTLELDLTGADATKKKYLWIYLTVEDYTATWTMYSKTEPRLYAIEGSAMIVGEDATVTFSADVTPDGGDAYGEYDLYSGTFTKWLDIPTGSVEAVYDAGAHSCTNGDARLVAFCGVAISSSMPDAPGWGLYDVENGRFISFEGMRIARLTGTSPNIEEVDVTEEVLSHIERNGGVKYVRLEYETNETYIKCRCYLYPANYTSKYHQSTWSAPSILFLYDPSTGDVFNGNTAGSPGNLYIPSTANFFNYSGQKNGVDARMIAPGVSVTDSGVFLPAATSRGYLQDPMSLDEGKIIWVGNRTQTTFRHNNTDYTWYCVAGTFNKLDGVECDGLAVFYLDNDGLGCSLAPAYPLPLVFDTREKLTFHTIPLSNNVFVSGDFKTINGVAAAGCAVILPPSAANLLDPSDSEYVAPDWKKLIIPLRYGTIEKPATYESLEYAIGDNSNADAFELTMATTSKVPCLKPRTNID